MSIIRERVKQFQAILDEQVINIDQLRKECFNGIPEGSGFRSICWKLLLGYLPVEKRLWQNTLDSNRGAYQQLIKEFICQRKVDPKPVTNDHPLNPDPDSWWMIYFQDNETLIQINKDARRLCPDFNFFQQATDYPCKLIVDDHTVESFRDRINHPFLPSANVTKNIRGTTNFRLPKKREEVEDYKRLPNGQEAHWEVVERLLFLYAKLNPGLSYVQGMNEVIGPIYYVFATDEDAETREFAEADTFFTFTHLMSEIRDFFLKSLDDSAIGIQAMISKFMVTLQRLNYPLWQRFQDQEIYPQYYGFRWITLLLSQEFALPDVIRLWDSLFSDKKRFEFLIFVCCAMLLLAHDKLMTGDFSHNLKLLQNYPSTDIHFIISKADELRQS